MNDLSLCLYAALAGFLASVCSIPLLMRLARIIGAVDRPAHRKIHKEPIPYLGGLAILAGFICSVALIFFMSGTVSHVEVAKVLAIAGASATAFLLGVVDDKFSFSARYKLLGQILIALFFTLHGYQFEVITLPGLGQINLYYLSVPFTTLWIISIVNAVNLIDGADGLAASVGSVILAVIALLAFYLQDRIVCVLALGALCATLGFLLFNWRPAKIYMGDAGSLGLGMIIATALLALGRDIPLILNKEFLNRSTGEPFLYHATFATAIVAYPMLELMLTVVRRFLQGKSIGSADKGHLHHRLMNRGWGADHVCLVAVWFSLLAGGTVVYSLIQHRGVAAWFLASGGLSAGILLHFCGLMDLLRPQFLNARPHFLLANHFISMQRIKLDLVENASELNALLAQTCLEIGIESFSMNIAPGPKQSEPSNYLWKRPPEAQATLLSVGHAQRGKTHPIFRDTVEFENGVTRAEWHFEPTATEEDIDVEYRVLMSEFMRKALDTAEKLYQPLEPADVQAAIDCQRAVSSLQLRRRSVVQKPAPPPTARPVPSAETDIPPAPLQNS